MKIVRESVFETNSSSTHTLVIRKSGESFYPESTRLAVKWADTDDDFCYSTFQEKVSYLVSHIADKHRFNVYTYEDLLDEIENDWEYRELREYVENLGYKIVFPPSYRGDIEEIVNINHQLRERTLEEVLDDLICEHHSLKSKLTTVLGSESLIELGRD